MAKQTSRAKKPTNKKKQGNTRRWAKKVTETSDALDLEKGVFKYDDPKKVAQSLKRSAKQSHRRQANPFHRAGDNLPKEKRKVLEDAKDELRKAFGREERND
jgi:hypothetical protein